MHELKRHLAILIPAHNESRVIKATLLSVLNQLPRRDLYVINDGSTDETGKIVKSLKVTCLQLKNGGKALALKQGLSYFRIIQKYQHVMFLDADTRLDSNFVNSILRAFKKKPNLVAAIGQVVGTPSNALTAYRTWEYSISQLIHKQAQSYLNAITVCPGCATVYQTRLFTRVSFSQKTLTEDMDLTFLIHRQNLGQIYYVPQAKVYTQDPKTIKDFLKQINRWYTGFWQCVVKHQIPWGGQLLDFEVLLIATESLIGSLFTLILLFLLPVILYKQLWWGLIPIALDLSLFMVPTLSLVRSQAHSKRLLFYLPAIYLTRWLAGWQFLITFFKVMLSAETRAWNQVSRYALRI